MAELAEPEGLTFETLNNAGHGSAEFTVARDTGVRHKDLLPFNEAIIRTGEGVPWHGYLDEPERSGTSTMRVACVGWAEYLSRSGYRFTLEPMKCSAFITDYLLQDEALSRFLQAGDIQTGDFDGPALEDIEPYKNYRAILDQYNAFNDWRLQVWGREVSYKPPKTAPDWIVLKKDLPPDYKMTDAPKNYWNAVAASSEPVSGTVVSVDVRNQSAIDEVGRIVWEPLKVTGECTYEQVMEAANKYLAKGVIMGAVGTMKVSTIYSAKTLMRAAPEFVRGGDVVRYMDLLPAEATIEAANAVNDIATFELKSVRYNREDRTVELVPTDWVSGIEASLARYEALARA